MLDVFFNMKKIKFDNIDELLNANKIDISGRKVNVFINLECVLKHLGTDKIDKYMRVKNENKVFQLISNIINLAAHYRLYFSSRQIESNVYVYLQYPFDTSYKNEKYIKEYRELYKFKYSTNINNYIIYENLSIAIDMAKIILDYIENVHMITSGEIENSVVPYIISKQNENVNFIVSTDIYDSQYCKYGFNILYSKQEPRLLTKNNVMQELAFLHNVNLSNLSYNHIPFMLAIKGIIDRNIYGIKGTGIVRAAKILRDATNIGLLNENIDNVNLVLPIINRRFRNNVENNIRCIDVLSQYMDCTSADIYNITSQLINKFDNVALKELNDKYFEEYPILLEALTSKPKSNIKVKF